MLSKMMSSCPMHREQRQSATPFLFDPEFASDLPFLHIWRLPAPPLFFSNAIINIYIFSVILDSRHFLDPYEFSAPVVPGNKLYCQNKEHDNATYLVGTLKIIAVIWSIHLFSLTQPVTCTSSQGCGTGLPDLLGRAADSQPANGVALLLWLLTHLQLGADPWPCRHQAAGTVPCPDTSLRV